MISFLDIFVDKLQASGRYTFVREEALSELGISEGGFRRTIKRLINQHRLARPRREFYVIVPLEYRNMKAPPPPWFLDSLMISLYRKYYVGLLSAAALYGASHQQAQEFQVITDDSIRSMEVGRSRIRFFKKRNVAQTPIKQIKTPTGYMNVSSPEATAFDLIRYVAEMGTLDQMATILVELQEQMSQKGLEETMKAGVELATIQRLGYLLEFLGYSVLATPLAAWLSKHPCNTIPLAVGQLIKGKPKNTRWHLIVNTEVEPDL